MPIGPNTHASQYPPCPEHEPAEIIRWRLLERTLTHRNLDRIRNTAEAEIRTLPDRHPMRQQLLHDAAQLGQTPHPAQIADLMNACQQAEPGLQQRIMTMAQQRIAECNADYNARKQHETAQRYQEQRQAEAVVSRVELWRWGSLCLILGITIAAYIGLTMLRRAYLSDQIWLDVIASIGIMLVLAYPALRAGRMFSDLRHGAPYRPKCRCPWAGPEPAPNGETSHALAHFCRTRRQ